MVTIGVGDAGGFAIAQWRFPAGERVGNREEMAFVNALEDNTKLV